MRGRKRPGRVEAAGGDIHEVRGVEVLVRQRRSACPQNGVAPSARLVSTGVPRVKRNSAFAKVTQATTGDAAERRHDWQWQTMLFAGLAVAE